MHTDLGTVGTVGTSRAPDSWSPLEVGGVRAGLCGREAKVVPLGDLGDPRARACMHWVSDCRKGEIVDLGARATSESFVSETLWNSVSSWRAARRAGRLGEPVTQMYRDTDSSTLRELTSARKQRHHPLPLLMLHKYFRFSKPDQGRIRGNTWYVVTLQSLHARVQWFHTSTMHRPQRSAPCAAIGKGAKCQMWARHVGEPWQEPISRSAIS